MDRDLNQVLAEHLRAHVERTGASQQALAKAAGVSQRTMGNILNPGLRNTDKANPRPPSATLATVQGCAQALNVEPWELFMPAEILSQFKLFRKLRESLRQDAPLDSVDASTRAGRDNLRKKVAGDTSHAAHVAEPSTRTPSDQAHTASAPFAATPSKQPVSTRTQRTEATAVRGRQ